MSNNYCICKHCNRSIDDDELYCEYHKKNGCNEEGENKEKPDSSIWLVSHGLFSPLSGLSSVDKED